MEIKFKTKENPEVRSVNFEFPESLEGLSEKFGSDAVYDAAVGQFIISIQATCRRHIEKSDAEIQALVDSWNPNERAAAVRATPEERAKNAVAKLSPEARAELLRQLMGDNA